MMRICQIIVKFSVFRYKHFVFAPFSEKSRNGNELQDCNKIIKVNMISLILSNIGANVSGLFVRAGNRSTKAEFITNV
jgi:hypothetical protein